MTFHYRTVADMIDADPRITGVYGKSGNGLCRTCGSAIGIEDLGAFNYDGEITCENCGRDTNE